MRVSRDHPLRHLGLGEEEPVKPALGDPRVTPLQGFDDRHSVDDHKASDPARIVHRQTEGNMAASIMSGDRELIKAQTRHQVGKIIGDRTFRLLAMIISDDRLARPPIATHVRADHGKTGADQLRCDPIARWLRSSDGHGSGVGRPCASKSYAQLHIPEIDHFVGKSLEPWSPPAVISLGFV